MCVWFIISEKREEIARIKEELRSKGLDVPPDKPAGEHFDSNCITPVSQMHIFFVITFFQMDLFYFFSSVVHGLELIIFEVIHCRT